MTVSSGIPPGLDSVERNVVGNAVFPRRATGPLRSGIHRHLAHIFCVALAHSPSTCRSHINCSHGKGIKAEF